MSTFSDLLDITQTIATPAALAFSSCLLLCLGLVSTKHWHGHHTLDFTDGVQKLHISPTPRVGGLPIMVCLIFAWSQSQGEIKELLTTMLISGLPAFIFGLAEDLTKRVRIRLRLLATITSGLLAWWLTDYSLSRLDIWGIDSLMKWQLVSVTFTAFAVGGVANAFNIIDGLNGLASGVAMTAFVGLAAISYGVGDGHLAALSMLFFFAVAGFFVVNWPFGKIFLGDGGSYLVGFSLAWIGVLLVERNPSVSAFAPVLVCVYPITEVLFSVYRRAMHKEHVGMPDRLHFHSLVKRRYIRRWFAELNTVGRNSIAGLLVSLFTLKAVILALYIYDSAWLSLLAIIYLGFAYVAVYARIVRHRWCSPFLFLFVKPTRVFARAS